jgi:hypothetical protein
MYSHGEKGWCDAGRPHRSAGRPHRSAALRALGNRWLEVLWHCLIEDVPYNESVHVANRNHALGRANQPSKLGA